MATFGVVCLIISWVLLALAQKRLAEAKKYSEESERLNKESLRLNIESHIQVDLARKLHQGGFHAGRAGEVQRSMH